jgi:hypothetical protein
MGTLVSESNLRELGTYGQSVESVCVHCKTGRHDVTEANGVMPEISEAIPKPTLITINFPLCFQLLEDGGSEMRKCLRALRVPIFCNPICRGNNADMRRKNDIMRTGFIDLSRRPVLTVGNLLDASGTFATSSAPRDASAIRATG